MSREDYLARTIDRKREASSTKAARSARQMFVRMLARQRLTAALAEVEPEERAALIYDVLDVAGEQLHPLVGRVEAATRFNAVAADICASLRLPKAIARASADQAFDKLTQAANDRGEP